MQSQRSDAVTAADEYEPILTFWFGELDDSGLATPDKARSWWKKDPVFDSELRTRFLTTRTRILEGRCDHWAESARGRLAAIIVLDQFSRNIHRGTSQMYDADQVALQIAEDGIDRGHDRELATDPRVFFYMPFMHHESLAAQERCVKLFRQFADELRGSARARCESNLKYAIMHHDIVARFGRFPHRNALLGRATTAEEQEFLQQPGSSF
jgi:uncharacterized protein (DUF924 family)